MEFILRDENVVKLETTHKGKSLYWDLMGFNRSDIIKYPDEFKYINDYLASLRPNVQDDIFGKMQAVSDVFEGFGNFDMKQKNLARAVTDLYAVIDEEDLEEWIKYKSDIPHATNLRSNYSEHDKDPAKTYLKHEYAGLIKLTIAMRFMTGIWGEYISHYHKKLGTDFKEYTAFRLLENTWVYKCDEIHRLRRYAEAWIKQENKGDATIMGGISSFEQPTYVLAHIVVRKVATGSLDKELDNGGIVVNIYRGLCSVLNDLAGKFSALSDKSSHIKNSNSGSDQSNWSLVELYKITEPMSSGDKVIIKKFINNTKVLAKQVDNTVPMGLIDKCVKNARGLKEYVIQEHAVVLSQWTLRSHVPARVFYELTRDELLRLMGLTQALLWHWEFHDLALLVTAEIDRTTLVTGQSTRVKKRVRNDPMDELNEVYPYHKPNKIKPRDNNPAHAAITMFKDNLRACWIINNPPEPMEEYAKEVDHDARGSLAPEDLATRLAELLVITESVQGIIK